MKIGEKRKWLEYGLEIIIWMSPTFLETLLESGSCVKDVPRIFWSLFLLEKIMSQMNYLSELFLYIYIFLLTFNASFDILCPNKRVSKIKGAIS